MNTTGNFIICNPMGQKATKGTAEADRRIHNWEIAGNPFKILDLDNLELTDFPPNLPTNLIHLTICNNQIKVIPDANHLPLYLETLRLNQNLISKIPDNLPMFLETLELNDNQIEAIPSNLPEFIKTLRFSRNQIQIIPATLPNFLRALEIENNQIRELPDNFPNALRNLWLTGNPVPIKILPCETWKLYAIRTHRELVKQGETRAAARCAVFRDELCLRVL